jgi:hypothetical protein
MGTALISEEAGVERAGAFEVVAAVDENAAVGEDRQRGFGRLELEQMGIRLGGSDLGEPFGEFAEIQFPRRRRRHLYGAAAAQFGGRLEFSAFEEFIFTLFSTDAVTVSQC